MGDAAGTVQEILPKGGNAPDLSGVRVVVVEQDFDFRVLLRLSLEKFGAQVRTAASVRAAMEILRGGFRPDVLVSDIATLGEDGNAFIRWVRALLPKGGATVPALAVAAHAGEEARARALQAGFQMHLTRPIDSQDLAERVARLLGPYDEPAAA